MLSTGSDYQEHKAAGLEVKYFLKSGVKPIQLKWRHMLHYQETKDM